MCVCRTVFIFHNNTTRSVTATDFKFCCYYYYYVFLIMGSFHRRPSSPRSHKTRDNEWLVVIGGESLFGDEDNPMGDGDGLFRDRRRRRGCPRRVAPLIRVAHVHPSIRARNTMHCTGATMVTDRQRIVAQVSVALLLSLTSGKSYIICFSSD